MGGAPRKNWRQHIVIRAFLKRLLPRDFVYNTTKFEGEGDINTCWRWCLARCVLGHISLKDFQKLFRQKVILRSTDDAVILMTLLKTIEHDLQ